MNAETPYENLLVIRPDALGEYILFSGMIPALRKKYQTSRITFFCTPSVAELAMRNPAWDAVVIWDHVRATLTPSYEKALFYPLLSRPWHTVLYPVTSRETRFDEFINSLRAVHKIEVDGDQTFQTAEETARGNLYYTRLLYTPKTHRGEISRNLALANEFELAVDCKLAPDLCIDRADDRNALHALATSDVPPIVIFPGPGAAIRAWGGYRFAKVIKWIRRHTPYPVWLCGPQRDALVAEAIMRMCDGLTKVENHCGRHNVPTLAALLSHVRLVLGSECGPLHLAAAVGTPNLVIMGGGQYGRFMPWSGTTRIVRTQGRCFNCDWFCNSSRPECLMELTEDIVIRELKDMLSSQFSATERPLVPR